MTTPATTSPYLSGNFAPLREEVTALDLEVRGSMPSSLDGRLLRIGPNPIEPVEPYHWFLGNGMVHGVRLRDGRAEWYRNRWVRDDTVVMVKGWPEVPGARHGMGGGMANTNVIEHGGRTYAIVEGGGLPVELTDELETVQRSDFDGTLPGSFTAHPKRDPQTGELHAVTYYWEWDHVRYIVVGTDGRVRRTVDVPVPGKPSVHDTAITQSQVVLFDLPVTFDLEALAEGVGFPYVWHPEYGARIGLLPRDGEAADVTWFEIEPCYVFHPLNAYDRPDGRVVLDAVRHQRTFDRNRLAPNEGYPNLTRWTLDPATGSSTEEPLDDRSVEFPRHDERLLGRQVRYGYCAEFATLDDGGLQLGSVLKYDLMTGTTEEWDPGTGRSAMETVFVPGGTDAAEDDGWLLTWVYDATTDRSEVVVLAAQDPAAGPVATVPLPQRVPYGFHGNWVPNGA